MRRRLSNRHLKKSLRRREKELAKRLGLFLGNFDSEKALDDEKNFHLLLKLRWLVYDYIYVRLKLNSRWVKKKWFLELFDVDRVEINDIGVKLTGDIVWWAKGNDAVGEWWPPDHKAFPAAPYKEKIRSNLMRGHWILEPVAAKLKKPKVSNRNAEYEIDFGEGSTHMKITSK